MHLRLQIFAVGKASGGSISRWNWDRRTTQHAVKRRSARRVESPMVLRLRCSSVTTPFSGMLPRRALSATGRIRGGEPGGHWRFNKCLVISGTGH